MIATILKFGTRKIVGEMIEEVPDILRGFWLTMVISYFDVALAIERRSAVA